MTTHLRRLSACAAAAALLIVGGGSGANAATALPAHVYAPYFETWTTDGIAATAQQSGRKYFTLAFLETLNKRSCTLAWNGEQLADRRLRPVPHGHRRATCDGR